MTNLFQSLTDGGFVQMGQFLMLFMVALLLLYLLDDTKCVAFKQYAFLMLLILIFPVTAKVLTVYQTAFYSKDHLWVLLPVTPLLGYGLVVASVKIVGALTSSYGRWTKSVSRRKESTVEAFVILGLSMVLFMCGTLRFGKVMTQETDGNGVIPATVCEVLDTIETSGTDSVKILATDEVARWVRIYDGKLILPYGRNLYEPEMTAFTYEVYTEEMYMLHDWINGELSEDEMYVGMDFWEECATNGYQYLIFKADNLPAGDTRIGGPAWYIPWDETAEYVICKLQ